MNWFEWKQHYHRQLNHPADFERMFVDKVLSKIAIINADDVIPQYHFVDSRGKNRYVDFMVINPTKGYLLAIELDGLTKLQDANKQLNYDSYQDLWYRQNELMRKIGVLFRYTNKDMLHNSKQVIQEIHDELVRQAMNKASQYYEKQQREELEYQLEQYKQRGLEQEQTNSHLDQIARRMAQLENHLASQQYQQQVPVQPVQPIQVNKPSIAWDKLMIGAVLAMVLLGVIGLSTMSNNKPVEPITDTQETLPEVVNTNELITVPAPVYEEPSPSIEPVPVPQPVQQPIQQTVQAPVRYSEPKPVDDEPIIKSEPRPVYKPSDEPSVETRVEYKPKPEPKPEPRYEPVKQTQVQQEYSHTRQDRDGNNNRPEIPTERVDRE
ncbi:hypothetical protein ACFBZI_09440 [Moraxella sp. ZJ142]|uniref:hypothetical protein n=1 Tax=Moraxella marmotae TaxID=3344520 RepID=UPI0035D443B6